MKDNGILKYYRSGEFSKNGVLDLSKAGIFDYSTRMAIRSVHSFVAQNGKVYFAKEAIFPREVEAEVLLSQVYNKAGLKNAVYTPAILGKDLYDGVVAVSEDVSGDKNIKVAKLFFDLKDVRYSSCLFPYRISERTEQKDERKIFTPNGVKDFALMLALDSGSYNIDRNVENFFVKTSSDRKIDEVISIDNGISYDILRKTKLFADICGGANGPLQDGYNPHFHWSGLYICGTTSTREEIVEELKTNEVLNEYISPHELAEKVGSLNIPEIARDIKDTIGYDVGKDMAEAYDKSFYTLAEELEQ